MGLKTKVVGNTGTLSAGIFHATISDFKAAKDENNNYLQNRKEEYGYEVTFSYNKTKTFKEILWFSNASLWKLKKLFRALQLFSDEVLYKDIIGKELWLCLAEEYINNDAIENPKNYVVVSFDYLAFLGLDNRPNLKGDPEKNNGVASDMFVINRVLELKKLELPKRIEGDSIDYIRKGIQLNEDFLNESKNDIEETPVSNEIEEEQEGF
jgi:hypothetical protein